MAVSRRRGEGGEERVLVWTKSRKDWPAEAGLLVPRAQADWQVVHIPCIEIADLPLKLPAIQPDYVVVTSSNAAQRLGTDAGLRRAALCAKQIFTHGAKTAGVLQAAGIGAKLVNVQTAEELCSWLGAHITKPSHVWLPTAAEPAFDLGEGLEKLGIATTTLPCYATHAEARQADGCPFSRQVLAQIQARWSGVICFASPSAVAGFAKVFAPAQNRLGKALQACVIGPTTAAAAAPHFRTVVAAGDACVGALVAKAKQLL